MQWQIAKKYVSKTRTKKISHCLFQWKFFDSKNSSTYLFTLKCFVGYLTKRGRFVFSLLL